MLGRELQRDSVASRKGHRNETLNRMKNEKRRQRKEVEKRKGGNEIGSMGYVRNLILEIMRNVNGNNRGNIAGGEKISKQQFSKISPQLLHTPIVFSRADVSH